MVNQNETPDPTQSCEGSWTSWSVPLLFRVRPPKSDRKLRHAKIRLMHGHHGIGPVCVFSGSTFHSGNGYEKYLVNSILSEGPWVVGLVHQRLNPGAHGNPTDPRPSQP